MAQDSLSPSLFAQLILSGHLIYSLLHSLVYGDVAEIRAHKLGKP